MSSIFEQPWTMLTGAAFCLVVIITIRQAFPDKRRAWQFAIPALLAVAAFGLDEFIKTDLEKINLLIETGMNAVENETPDVIGTIISPDYRDSRHNSKQILMAHCRSLLKELKIEKNKKLELNIEISAPTATVLLKVLTRFDEQGLSKQLPTPFLTTRLKLYLEKTREKQWLIGRAEVLEINNQRIEWKDIRSLPY
jgi:hypothetical protein